MWRKLNDVKEALQRIGIVGMNVTECRGHGRQGGIELMGRSGAYIDERRAAPGA
ncbi:MAG: P-II family nitrogen regulator [Anaerolineae bacterium]